MKRLRKYISSLFTFDPQLLEELEDAILSNSLAAVEENVGFIKDINIALPISGMTPVELALNRSDASMMELLLKRGSRVDVRTRNGCSLVFNASANGCLTGVKVLVEYGADISARSPDGCTCLFVAAKNYCFQVVSYLMGLEVCNVNETTSDGYNVLHHVTLLDSPRLLSTILGNGADINAQTRSGQTALFLATKNSCTNCLRVLLEAGADPDIGTKNGEFAIHAAVSQGNTEFVKMLLKHGADRTKIEMDGMTPIQRAMGLNPYNESIVDSLLNDKAVVFTGVDASLECKLEGAEMNKLQHEVKECVYCPITFEVMQDPVIAADGHTYERSAIEQWIRQKQESPVTRQRLASSTLIPNIIVRHLITQYVNISGASVNSR